MTDEKDFPNLGTPEEAEAKMKQGYLAFLDTISKFVTLCNIYSKAENEKKSLSEVYPDKGNQKLTPDSSTENKVEAKSFLNDYMANKAKLRKATPEEFYTMIASYAVYELEYAKEIKDTVADYLDIMGKKRDERDLSDYDKCCDRLAVRDSFTDLKNDIDNDNRQIIQDKELLTNVNNPKFDPNAVQAI